MKISRFFSTSLFIFENTEISDIEMFLLDHEIWNQSLFSYIIKFYTLEGDVHMDTLTHIWYNKYSFHKEVCINAVISTACNLIFTL